MVCSYRTAYFRDRLMLYLYGYKAINGGVLWVNIEVVDDRVLLGAYEDGKIARRLFFINKEQFELLIDGLKAVNVLIHKEVDLSQFIIK